MIQIDYVSKVSAPTQRLTRKAFRQMIESPEVRFLIEDCRNGELEQKKRLLPGICWQATFKDGKRTEAHAQPNGVFALDIDHISRMKMRGVETPLDLWLSMKERTEELDILCVHQTPSADGLRVVALCQPQFGSIAENQAWLASELRCTYDPVCKDWARLFFISIPEDFYYIDEETLFDN